MKIMVTKPAPNNVDIPPTVIGFYPTISQLEGGALYSRIVTANKNINITGRETGVIKKNINSKGFTSWVITTDNNIVNKDLGVFYIMSSAQCANLF